MIILGITHPYSTNNAACLLVDGKLIAFAEEERFIRYKHAPNIGAKNAMEYCLKMGGIKFEDVDFIAVGMGDWQKSIFSNLFGQSFTFAQRKIRNTIKSIRWYRWRLPFSFKDKRVINVNHHLAHVASSVFVSGFDESTFISFDGAGESESGIIGYAKGDKINVLARITNEASWGALYENITGVLGFKQHSEEGKVMGLASYGKPDLSQFNFIDWNNESYPKIDAKKKHAFLKTIKIRKRDEEITQYHKDLAATLQAALEKAGLHMVKYLHEKTGIKNLSMSGGVALNCSMNGILARSEYVDNIFVQPASSDAGTALGAAMYVYVEKTGKRSDFIFEHAYWGPEFTNEEIEQIIKECKVTKYRRSENVSKEAAELIASKKIVGWFQGRMEVGPRALGNRSILANPTILEMKDEVNKNVKKRESWRPFAPSILEESADQYVDDYKKSPFMILAFNTKKEMIDKIPAAIHVDNTARVQAVSKKHNERYWNLINELKNINGTPVVLNTSFNLAGEPVVCNPRDAIRTFFGSGIDCLAIGDFIIEK